MDYMQEVRRLGFRRFEAKRGSTFSNSKIIIQFRINPNGGDGVVKKRTRLQFPKMKLLETNRNIYNINQGLNWSLDMMKKYGNI